MRLPGGTYLDKQTGKPAGRTEIIHVSERRYTVAEIEACLPPVVPSPTTTIRRDSASTALPPRPPEALRAALNQVPPFSHGAGQYQELLGLAMRLHVEVGATQAEQLLAETCCKGISDLAGYFNTTPSEINAGSIWPYLRDQWGIDIKRHDLKSTFKPGKRIEAVENCTAQPGGATVERLQVTGDLLLVAPKVFPSGWQVIQKGKYRTPIQVCDLCDLIRGSVGKQLAFNEMTLVPEYNGSVIPEHHVTSLYCFLSEHGYKLGKESTADALLTIAREQSFHPVKQYLEAVEADRSLQPADLDTIARDYLGAESETAAAIMRATLVGAVARAIGPGCQFDAACVLKGPQGTLKSSFWETLASPAWFTSTMPQGDKDALLNIHSCWIFELAELESITNSRDAGALKNLITTRSDLFRAPYGKATTPHPRASIFVGSVNNDTFLRDETGSRRFWVIEPTSKPDLKKLQANRDAIWKAAVLAYRAGELPMLSDKHQAISDAQNGSYEAEDPWIGLIDTWSIRQNKPFDTADAITGAEIRDRTQIQRADERRAADCLRRLGFKQDKHQSRQEGERRSRLWRSANMPQMSRIVSDENSASETPLTPVMSSDLAMPSQMPQIKHSKVIGNKSTLEARENQGEYTDLSETSETQPKYPAREKVCPSQIHQSHPRHPRQTEAWHAPALKLYAADPAKLPWQIALGLEAKGYCRIKPKQIEDLIAANPSAIINQTTQSK